MFCSVSLITKGAQGQALALLGSSKVSHIQGMHINPYADFHSSPQINMFELSGRRGFSKRHYIVC